MLSRRLLARIVADRAAALVATSPMSAHVFQTIKFSGLLARQPEMSEPNEQPVPTRAGSLIETAGKWLALIGSVVAAGQAGTAWLRGYWQAEAEKQKSAQELALAQLKD